MSEAATAIPDSDGPDQPPRAARPFNVFVFLIALGTVGILLFWVYRTFSGIRKDADDVGRVFGLLAPPRRKSRLPRIASKG